MQHSSNPNQQAQAPNFVQHASPQINPQSNPDTNQNIQNYNLIQPNQNANQYISQIGGALNQIVSSPQSWNDNINHMPNPNGHVPNPV